MSRVRRLLVAFTVLVMVLGPAPVFVARQLEGYMAGPWTLGRPSTQAIPEATRKQIGAAFGRLPLYFIENKGQVDSRVGYYLQAGETTVYFTAEGLTYALTAKRGSAISIVERLREAFRPRTALAAEPGQRDDVQRWALKLDFVGANPGVRPKGQDLHSTTVSYFKGPRDQWKTGLKTYSTITYKNLWPGIDLVYSAASQLKYTFVVRPGADPNQIRLAYRGATDVRINSVRQLEVATPAGSLRDDKPYVYQEIDGRRVEVESAYELAADRGSGSHNYGFRVGTYDKNKSLVIDPAVVFYAGYIGGAQFEFGRVIATDGAGNAYITGRTVSTEASFPVTVGPDLTFNGVGDAFVVKVNATGTALLYAGYIGGNSNDFGQGIAVDSAGNAYIAGQTSSTETTFPAIGGPDLTFNGGGGDAFVAKVNAAGTGLVYAGYIGGNGFDDGTSVAIDGMGNAYVTGTTPSTAATFPVTVGPDLTHNGSNDAFVAKVNPAGTALVYAGYIGGSSDDVGMDIAVDGAGSAYITGRTGSTQATFPVAVGPDLTHNGDFDAFVAKVNAAGTGLDFAGYIGGNTFDDGNSIAVDGSGNAYVTGRADSTQATFPVTVGPDLTYNFGSDAFVAKVNASGTALVYAGYIGGASLDVGNSIAVDSSGNAYVTGLANSSETTFPVTGGPDLTHNGSADAFVAKVNAAGTALVYAGYVGGSGLDDGRGIAVDGAGNAYVTGQTTSTQASFPVAGGPDLTYNGGGDAFVAKIAEPVVVSIDIKPGNFPNALPDTDPLNLSSNGVTPVAIFTTPDFDAATTAPSTVAFAEAPAIRSALEDVDGDGDLDMVLHFDTEALNLDCSSTEAGLTGQTTGGTPIVGTDTVRILKDRDGVKCP